jgi:NADH-quinone oxidoreductase subunit F
MIKLTQYLSHSYGKPDSYKLSAYEAAGGYRGVRKALGMTRDQVVDEMKKAHIRGRGGAGFDCGTKWSFMPKGSRSRTTWWSTPTRASRAPSKIVRSWR